VVCLAAEPQPIAAMLDDGRVVRGQAAYADAQHLWLQQTADGIEILSGFRWSSILAVKDDRQAVDVNKLRDNLPPRPAAKVIEHPLPIGTVRQSAYQPAVQPIRSLHIECVPANWDDRPDIDGLLVTIWPLNDRGQLEATSGLIELVLRAEHEGLMFPSRDPRQLPELARASHRVQIEDFQNGPAVYRLPFGVNDPEANPAIGRYGVVHARLGISGLGVFEATDAFVCLRNSSSLRDRLQHATGQRYFSFEQPGR